MKQDQSTIVRDLLENTLYRMDENMRMVRKSFELLKEEDLWEKPNATSNSIGNLIVHLCGNMTQYVLAGLGGREDQRRRDEEFTINGGLTKAALMDKLTAVTSEVKQEIKGLTEEQLTGHYRVQGFDLSGTGILLHVVEHFSYHTGQIAFWIKLMKNRDLKFYEGFDLNAKNESEC
ncbi:Uncharacterized damage-inducible protein DinB (forms a four-helix bundle) [Muriicola jejuensis]|uniref:DUF1572 domain-containing protein n=1 Tax=Muriicola jejuensis TaxID=504488 RepID=A0A6P0ULW1_9FLAO|nr:DinB family protein [Muriicola jejuensis]NER11236.1 DUF1572 domain-containing protein [Muriicola jejuensis]SMP21861.1 Uncharacterized damage-inducible protein DinB (forms a four-helix bundle) [Muriicola jejuensis]